MNCLKKAILICSLAGIHFCSAQEQYRADLIPAPLRSRASSVVRSSSTNVDMRSEDQVILTVKRVITVLNKSGDERAALVLYYDRNTSIKSIKGTILDAYGKQTSKFSQSDFRDQSAVSDFSLFEDDRVKTFTPSVMDYPYTMVYELEIRSKQNLVLPSWTPAPYPDQSVEQSSYTFSAKPGTAVRIKALNYKGEPVVTEGKDSKSQTWEIKNQPAFKPEPYAPNPESYRTSVKIAPVNFNYYGHKGTYTDWESLGNWIYVDLVKSRQTLSPEVLAEVRALVEGIDNDKDKARKLYEYLQQKTRYISVQIGIGGHQPMTSMEVHKLAYGDCKALVSFMQSLLKAVNIPSYYCVVNAGNYRKDMDTNFASMDQGNHIILCLPLKNDTTWLECTSQRIPFGFLGSFTDGRTVLACAETGSKILTTPVLSAAVNLLKRKVKLDLSAEGSVTGDMETTFSGSQYDETSALIDKPAVEQLKQLKSNYDIDNIDFSGLKIVQQKTIEPSSTESFHFAIPRYAAKTDNHFYLTLNIFNKMKNIPESRNRTLPVYINRGYTDEDELKFNLPKSAADQLRDQNFNFSNDFGSYRLSIRRQGEVLVYQRKFVLNSGTFPPEKYVDFVNFISTVNQHDQNRFVYKTGLTQN